MSADIRSVAKRKQKRGLFLFSRPFSWRGAVSMPKKSAVFEKESELYRCVEDPRQNNGVTTPGLFQLAALPLDVVGEVLADIEMQDVFNLANCGRQFYRIISETYTTAMSSIIPLRMSPNLSSNIVSLTLGSFDHKVLSSAGPFLLPSLRSLTLSGSVNSPTLDLQQMFPDLSELTRLKLQGLQVDIRAPRNMPKLRKLTLGLGVCTDATFKSLTTAFSQNQGCWLGMQSLSLQVGLAQYASVIPLALSNCPLLYRFNARCTGPIVLPSLEHLSHLRVFILYCKVTTFPATLFRIDGLVKLTLDQVELRGLPSLSFPRFSDLKKVRIGRCGLNASDCETWFRHSAFKGHVEYFADAPFRRCFPDIDDATPVPRIDRLRRAR